MKTYSKKACQAFVNQSLALRDTSMTMHDIYEYITTRYVKEKCCVYFDEDDHIRSYTYAKYKDNVWYLAKHVSGMLSGIPARSIVALKLKNSPTWPLMFWAILMTGHPVLLVAANLQHDNTERLLSQSKAKAIIANEEDPYSVPLFRLNNVRNADEDATFTPKWADEVIFCSSGTTGAIKMMVMHGKNLCAQIISSTSIPEESTTLIHPGSIRILAMIPFHHIFGFVAVFLWYSFYGKTLVYPNSISSRDVLKAVRQAKCTHLYSVPIFCDSVAQQFQRSLALMKPSKQEFVKRMLAYHTHQISRDAAGMAARKFVCHSVQRKLFGTKIEYCISGGGYLLPKTNAVINGLGYPLYNGYGMTEIGVASVEQSPKVELRLLGSIGKPFAGFEYKIVPHDASHSDEGMLWIRSATVHDEEIIGGVRQKTVLEDGFFPTGDIATKDADGRYYLRGRSKDVIISSNGENVYPDEIESYFTDIKSVKNLAVFGVNQENVEHIILVLDLENSASADDFKRIQGDIDSINATLPNEKRVHDAYVSKKPLPMSTSMKVQRAALKRDFHDHPEDFLSLIRHESNVSSKISFDGFDEEETKKTVEKVRKIFSKILYLPEYKIDLDASWDKDLGGDSMSYITMVEELNHEFHLSIPTEKYGVLLTVNAFALEILTLKNGKKNNEK